jgi:transcriptional regulator with XRE-family HTH domain
MATTKSAALDAMVGARIRMLRANRGISQTALAARIGVTFQQVQKYERGAGRVGASRLARIASALDVSVGEFFEPSQAGPPGVRSPAYLLAEPDFRRILEAYARMPSPRLRACIAQLVETIADQGSETKATVAHLNTGDPGERRKCPKQG